MQRSWRGSNAEYPRLRFAAPFNTKANSFSSRSVPCRSRGEGNAAELSEELELITRDRDLLDQYYRNDMIFYEDKALKAECASHHLEAQGFKAPAKLYTDAAIFHLATPALLSAQA